MLIPTTLVVGGGSIGCGMPVTSAFTEPVPTDQFAKLVELCRQQSLARVFAGLAVGTVGAGGGTIMCLLAPRRPEPYWDGYRWVQP